jgi:hypothetical protein
VRERQKTKQKKGGKRIADVDDIIEVEIIYFCQWRAEVA